MVQKIYKLTKKKKLEKKSNHEELAWLTDMGSKNEEKSHSDSSDSSDSDSEDVFGPSLIVPDQEKPQNQDATPVKKKRRTIKSVIPESMLASNLPLNESYRYSYEQESNISTLTKTQDDELIIVGLKNGTVKFFKKQIASSTIPDEEGTEIDGQLELLKQFSAHPEKSIVQLIVNHDDSYLASIAQDDDNIKIFDLRSLDMIQAIKLEFVPNNTIKQPCCWFKNTGGTACLAISEKGSRNIHFIDPENDNTVRSIEVHRFPITSLIFNFKYNFFISSDIKGIVEFWNDQGELPASVSFKLKSETNLFEIAKNKAKVSNMIISPDSNLLVTASQPDNVLRIFNCQSGKLLTKIDQSLAIHEKEDLNPKILSFERKMISEDLNTLFNHHNMVFDDTGKVLIFPSIIGIKILNLQTMKIIKVLGQEDQIDQVIRFNNIGLLNKSAMHQLTSSMLASNNSLIDSKLTKNPILVCSAINSNKLYVFNNKSQTDDKRDFTLTNSLGNVSRSKYQSKSKTITNAILHTSLGDIKIKLFPSLVPRTVENFVKLCQNQYYNNVIFHRVIKDFMIQTGDPLGDGTGGQSIWGTNFKDEFNPMLKHFKPFMVSMANSGPDSNASQFFITTQPAPWLDNKHSVFGEVVDGSDTVKAIESQETDKTDRPINQILLLSTSLES